MFQEFTGKEYLKIDIASNFGKDKESWNDRIAWFDENEHQLDSLVNQAEEPALFYAGIQAWEKSKNGLPSGYPISLDATCSGIQILSVLAGDERAASICNVVDTGKREDAYTSVFEDMVQILGNNTNGATGSSPRISRKETKQAIMTAFYGSTATPKRIFGEGELLDIFYNVLEECAPGAWDINQTMLALWDPSVLQHDWVLPDNFHVKIKVMGQKKETVHFLNEPFEVTYHINTPIKEGRSLGANMVHSIDGMVVREMVRRCSYDTAHVKELKSMIEKGVAGRSYNRPQDKLVRQLWTNYQESNFLSARILNYLDMDNLGLVNRQTILKLIKSLPEKSFELISVHDCFRCLPNYGNDLRRQYNNLLASIAESNLLSYVVSQMCKRPIQTAKLNPTLSKDIRETNYALS